MAKTINIDPVTRIEGHARVFISLGDDGAVKSAGMIVNELRGFERILVGMSADKLPQITGRICGVCPTAHHLASAKTLDAAAGVDPPPAAKMMRELMYMGHYIHSHTLALFVLEGPDLVFDLAGDPLKRNIVGVVEAAPEVAKKALRLRTLGQKINESVGGKGVNAVTAVVGGMSYRMTEEQRATIEKWVDECVTLGVELAGVGKDLLVKLIGKRPELMSKLALPAYSMGTVKQGKLNLYDGQLRIQNPSGQTVVDFPVAQYDKHLVERALEWSYMKPVYVNDQGKENVYRVGTLARTNCAEGMETPLAQEQFDGFRRAFGRPCHATPMQIYARVIELVYAIEKAKALVSDKAILGESRVPAKFRGGRGVGHVEAPRGTLIHDYQIDEGGIVRSANLIVATQQNYAAINRTIHQAASHYVVGKGDDALLNAVEFSIRCYDPCLSCATHAVGRMPLEVEVRRGDDVVHVARRNV